MTNAPGALQRAFTLLASPAPLLLIGIFSLLLVVALQASVFGLALLCIIGSWFLKYAFVLLEHTAQGRPGAPVLSIEDANPFGEKRPLLFALLIAAWFGTALLIGAALSEALAGALRIAGMIALPAVIAVHAVTGSMRQALNPRAVIDMMQRLGSGYLTVMLVAVACALLAQWIVIEDAANVGLVWRIACAMLLWLLLFALLGAVIHDRRLEIGFDPEHSPERTAQRDTVALEKERARFVDQVFAEYRSGSSHNAWATIQKRAGLGAAAITEYQWMLERMVQWPNQSLAQRVARELLGLLLAHQRNGAALQVVRAQVKADATFRPATAEQTVQLAQLARDGGEWPLARTLLSDFDARFPAHPAQARVVQLQEQLLKK
ncbi:MAG: DUF4013 domain-containing protein [Gammaproteobacteria bacterium]|jgi:hypothetical protein|nr:DUF4013 domain-containing protein [Gammaproteobacteria bacterium]MDH5227228.1 DUF4013 domain-containing protein [Gammaproteobacteria bacterium]